MAKVKGTKLTIKKGAKPKTIKSVKVIKSGKPKAMHPGAVKVYKKKKNWIAGAIKHPGALRRAAGVKKGQKIPAGKLAKMAKMPGKMGARARLAQTLSGFRKGKK